MSLEYKKEESENPVEESENFQRTSVVAPVYSIILIVCLVAVFICQAIADSQNAEGLKISAIIAGFVKPFFAEGQYWRILTGAALHGGIMHLFFNSYALFSFGRLIETLSNRTHLAIIFLLAAIGGGILSFIFSPEGVSVGASGGIVGLLGYMTVYGFKRRKLLPEGFLKDLLVNIAIIAGFGIILMSSIDNFAHLGGLIVGAVYGFLQVPNDLYKDPREIGQAANILGFVALVVFILTAIFSILLLLGIININFPAQA